MKARVSVVIPVKDQPLFVMRCINSLRQQGDRLDEIIIVDDGSNEETQAALKALEGVKVYRNVGSEGFIKSVRRGVGKSTNPYVLILNSDTELYPHCIENLANNLDDGAGVCGGLLIYPPNHPYPRFRAKVQHAGIMYSYEGVPEHVMSGFHPDDPAVRTWRSINSVTGAMLMTKRELWDKIGGFDLRLSPGVYEDCMFCLSVKKLGLEVVYEPKAVALHYEHASQTESMNWFNNQHLQDNLALLFLNHGKPQNDSYLYFKIRQ